MPLHQLIAANGINLKNPNRDKPFWHSPSIGKKMLSFVLHKKIGGTDLWVHGASIKTLWIGEVAGFNALSDLWVLEGSVKTSSKLNALKAVNFEVWCRIGADVLGCTELQPMLSANAVSSFTAVDRGEIEWTVYISGGVKEIHPSIKWIQVVCLGVGFFVAIRPKNLIVALALVAGFP